MAVASAGAARPSDKFATVQYQPDAFAVPSDDAELEGGRIQSRLRGSWLLKNLNP